MGIVGLMLLCSVAMLLPPPDAVEWPPKRILQRLLVMVIVLLMYARALNGSASRWRPPS